MLYSDGVTDAQNEAGEEFGEERLLQALLGDAPAPAELIDRVLSALNAFVGGAPQFDDITLLVVKRL